MKPPVLWWLRRDLRLGDQPALVAAIADGPVVPVYVLDDATPGDQAMGGASRWWLHQSLAALGTALEVVGSRLILRRGRTDAVLASLLAETGATRIHCIEHYEPWWRVVERAVAQIADLAVHDGNYLAAPGTITTGGRPYRIFTPFWRALSATMPPPPPLAAPAGVPGPSHWPDSDTLADWRLEPTAPDWAGELRTSWTPGEAGAVSRLDRFAARAASGYGETRNLPSIDGSARLSPHLHFGEISPRQAWHAVADAGGSVETFLAELGWRDFAQNLIVQFPDYAVRDGAAALSRLAWRGGAEAEADLIAWQRGRTGYPIVDAGMRQLWRTGWMHNRVRMLTASFLVKHLLIDWRRGERWFWDTLVDADYANNSVNWQWVAGSGVDASMFVRIMAPLSQSAKFDSAGYIRRWVDELAGLDDQAIHDPEGAGVRPAAYPAPIIGHRAARDRALAAYRGRRAVEPGTPG